MKKKRRRIWHFYLIISFLPSPSPFFSVFQSVLPILGGTLLEPAFVSYNLSVLYIAVVKDQLINHFIQDLEDSFQFLQLRVVFKYCNVFNQYVFCLPAVKQYLLAWGEGIYFCTIWGIIQYFFLHVANSIFWERVKKNSLKMKYCSAHSLLVHLGHRNIMVQTFVIGLNYPGRGR